MERNTTTKSDTIDDGLEEYRDVNNLGEIPLWIHWRPFAAVYFGGDIPGSFEKPLSVWYAIRGKRQLGRIDNNTYLQAYRIFLNVYDEQHNDKRFLAAKNQIDRKIG
jgi:hypothetical protein